MNLEIEKMIRFALVVASVLGFVLTAALGNMMVPLLRELQRAARAATAGQRPRTARCLPWAGCA